MAEKDSNVAHRNSWSFLGVVALLAASPCMQAFAAIPAAERSALLDLYTSTGGSSSWIYSLNWNGPVGSECGDDQSGAPPWFGITCDSANSHVVSIYLPENNLNGSLPASLGTLTSLQTLNLSTNSLSGSIPPLATLTALQNVSLEENTLIGSIPSLSALTNLVGFDVSDNKLSGVLPSLDGLVKLQGFNASINLFGGSLPSLSTNTSLQVFDVHANALTGALPSLGGLTGLQAFYAQGNEISGSIPALDGLVSLQFLNLHGNQLSGTIPSLTSVASLKNLDVGANSLTGALPSLSALSALNAIDIGANQLSGVLPSVPASNALVAGASVLCGNSFTATASTDWDRASGVTPWYSACGLTLAAFNLDQHGLTGAWYNPATGGQGLLIETYKDLGGAGQGYLAAGWYTFDVTAAGGQRWYTLQGAASTGAGSVPLGIYASTGGNFNAPPKISATQVGTATLTFSDCATGSLSYNFNDGRTGTIPLNRADPNITCSPAGDNGSATQNYLLSGAWYDPNTSGQGFFFDINPAINLFFAGWYTYLPNGASIGGGASQQWFTVQDNAFTPGTLSKTGMSLYAPTGGVFNSGKVGVGSPVGTVDVKINSCTSITLSYTIAANFLNGTAQTGTINLSRAVSAPAGCTL